jgi:multiple sugar transport system permease protein
MAVQQSSIKTTAQIKRNPKYFNRDAYLGGLLIAPALLIILIVMIIPLAYGLLLSLTDYQLGSKGIGHVIFLTNYLNLFQDADFIKSLGVTLVFTVGVLFAELTIGITIAVLLMKTPFHLGRVFRTIYTIPLLISPIIVGLAWRYMYDPTYGLIYQGLGVLHLENLFGGLGSVNWALFCIMVADIWQTTPFILLVATSGLAAIPTDLYEAGMIDGAGGFSLFFHVTLPLLEKVIIVLSIIRGVDAFRVFDIIYALTGGGPANATQSLSIYIFKQGFVNYQMGYAMAISIITMIILLVIFLPLIKRSNDNTNSSC